MIDSAGGHSRSGNSTRTMLYDNADSVPAPSPCTIRPASSAGMDGASAHSTDPTMNRASAARYRLRAHMPPASTEAMTYSVVFQAKYSSPPMSRTTVGRMVMVMNTLMLCIAMPPATTRLRTACPPRRSSPQPPVFSVMHVPRRRKACRGRPARDRAGPRGFDLRQCPKARPGLHSRRQPGRGKPDVERRDILQWERHKADRAKTQP